MKLHFYIFTGLMAISSINSMHAYIFSFVNKTGDNLFVRIKLSPSRFENWFPPQKLMKWGGVAVFKVGGRKIGFCLSKIQYSYDSNRWENAAVEWVEGEAGERFDRALQIIGTVADVAIDIGKEAINIISPETLEQLRTVASQFNPYLNTLSSVLDMSDTDLKNLTREELEKQISERFIQPHMKELAEGNPEVLAQLTEIHKIANTLFLKDIHIVGDTVQNTQFVDTANQKITTGKAAVRSGVQFVTNPLDTRLSNVITSVGVLIKYSWCKDLQFDIVKNEENKIKFLIQVGQ